MTPPSSPKGSLEELFRHHLLESEAAAVPPLPHVWEQLDNSLLLKQNAHYRRRLQAYRWAMAASLLLAALAGGGWWRSQSGQAPLAAGTTPAGTADGRPVATNRAPAGADAVSASPTQPAGSVVFSPATYAIGKNSTLSVTSASATPGTTLAGTTGGYFGLAPGATLSAYGVAGLAGQPGPSLAFRRSAHSTAEPVATRDAVDTAYPDLLAAATADHWTAADQLAARLANLQVPAAAAAALPARLAAAAASTITGKKPVRPWQLQVAYAAGVYDPNVDFTKAAADYDASLGPGTVLMTRDAAAEYRHHLRLGLSQRLSVWATRRLGIGRWNLRTGLELSQNEASSSSSVAFVGEQVATLNAAVQVQANHLQTTTYRYRTVGIPLGITYVSPMRSGFSLYGHAGTLFSALLNVRSEVAGDPEATRDYAFQAASSPYRQLLTNVRGGVGLRYQPSHHQWTLNLGPVAEAGVLSLNSDPTQDFWNQRRPYSFGLEAGVEFNSLLKPTPAPAP